MQKWEYLTKFLEANGQNQNPDSLYNELIDAENLPKFSPLFMDPGMLIFIRVMINSRRKIQGLDFYWFTWNRNHYC